MIKSMQNARKHEEVSEFRTYGVHFYKQIRVNKWPRSEQVPFLVSLREITEAMMK